MRYGILYFFAWRFASMRFINISPDVFERGKVSTFGVYDFCRRSTFKRVASMSPTNTRDKSKFFPSISFLISLYKIRGGILREVLRTEKVVSI